MAGVAYRGSFVSFKNVTYRVDIYDLSGSPSLATLEHIESCRISYGTENKDLTTGILGAELSLGILVKDSTLLTFCKNIIAQDSQRYLIAIYKKQPDNSYNIYWAGNIIQDQCAFTNNSTTEGVMFMIRAMDFGLLQSKFFSNASAGKSLSKLVIDTIRLGEYAELYSAGQSFLTNNMRWRDTKITHSTSTNYLNTLYVNQAAWYEFDQKEQTNKIPAVKALLDTTTVLGSRLIQSNGLFWFVQLENYVGSTVTFYNLSPQNASPSTSTVTPFATVDNSSTDLVILGGASYEYYRPYSQAFIQKNIATNVLSTGTQLSSSKQTAYFGNGPLTTGVLLINNFISTGNGNKLCISGTIKLQSGQVNNPSSILIKLFGLSLYNSTTGQRTNFNGLNNTKLWNSTTGSSYNVQIFLPTNFNKSFPITINTFLVATPAKHEPPISVIKLPNEHVLSFHFSYWFHVIGFSISLSMPQRTQKSYCTKITYPAVMPSCASSWAKRCPHNQHQNVPVLILVSQLAHRGWRNYKSYFPISSLITLCTPCRLTVSIRSTFGPLILSSVYGPPTISPF